MFTICGDRFASPIGDYCASRFDDDRAITMLGISRWTDKGGSYRTIQRFFATSLPWQEMQVKFFETHLFNSEREYILAGDETVVGKSGGETFGVNRFFPACAAK